jgi:hypothetical protein
MKIILVCIGNFQEYILDNIQNLYLHNNTDITVITEKEYFDKFEEYEIELVDRTTLDDLSFNELSLLDKDFRNGFTHFCSLRFFYLYSYLNKNNIDDCIHIENDVLIYYDLNNTLFSSEKLCACFDCESRVIPSVIYIPKPSTLKYILDHYDNRLNDMQNFGRHANVIEKLPIFNDTSHTLSQHFNKYNIIFDAAALGQYLGGVDERNIPGNTEGFINETSLIKFNIYNFYWKKINNLYYPFIEINGESIRIFNLHIHCKKLYTFVSSNPIENDYIKIQ